MSFACPSLPANLISFPALNPRWDSGTVDTEQLPNAEAIAEILMAADAEPLALRLNARGLEVSRNCGPGTHEIWRRLEEVSPNIVEELYLFHVDQNQPAEPAPVQAPARKPEKRALLTTYTANKVQRIEEPVPEPTPESPQAQGGTSMFMDEPGWDDDQQYAPEAPAQPWEDFDATAPLIQLLHEFISSEGAMFWEDVMDDISREVSKLKARNMLQRVPSELYRNAFRFVENAVTQCTTNGTWGEQETEQCLSAVGIVMDVVSEESVGPSVYSDELLQCIISIIEGFVNRVILPLLEKEYKEQLVLETEKKEAGRRGRPRARDRQSRDWRSDCMKKSASVTHQLNLLTDVLSVEAIRFQDGELLRISQMCLNLFFVEGADALYHLQYTSVNLLQAVFAFYPQHRDNVISEVVVRASTWKPASKDCSFSLPPPRLGSIQMLSALILSLLQGVGTKPNALMDPGFLDSKPQNPALPLVVMLVKQLVDKLTVKRGEGHSGSGYKPLFQTLVIDCCAVLGSPEWPVAPLMLRALWKFAYEMCIKAMSEGLTLRRGGFQEAFPLTHRNLAAELLGTIVCRVQQDSEHEQSAFLPPQQTLKDLQEQQGALVRRFMQREEQKNEGRRSLHEEPEVPLVNLDVFEDEHEAANKLYAQQLVLNFLADKATKDASAVHAHRLWISTWIEDPPHASAAGCYELQWLTLESARMNRGCPCPSAAEANALACYLVSKSYKFDDVIKPLLILLKNPKMPVFRQKALKALSTVVEEDPEMLTQENVRTAVSGSMTDASKSVRAEAVLLVGKFMSKSDNLTSQYYESICARCKDSGSSVRKAALNILRDLLCRENQIQSVVESACVAIIPLLKDESDDIKKRTCTILKEMWFPHTVVEGADGTSQRSNLSVPARFEQMRHVVNAAHKSTSTVGREAASVTEVLEDFMRATIKESPKNAEECAKFCQEALQCIIREHEEGADEEKKVTASLLSQFRTLALLATVQPSLIVKDMELLHQHLSSTSYSTSDGKPWGQEQCQLIGTVAAIYDCVLPHLTDPPKHLIQYLQQDLPKLVRFAPNMQVDSAICLGACFAMPGTDIAYQLLTISIKCLCTLVQSVGSTARNAKHMHQVLTVCFNHETQRLTDPEFKAKPRSLVIAGLFCRFSTFSLPVGDKDTPAIPENKVQWLYDVCLNKFVRHQMAAYRRAGYACLGSLFVRKPTLVLKEASKKALAAGLAETESEEIRAVALKALADFVEEDVSDTQATSLRNSVMQNYLERILACTFCKSEETATAALKLVATIHERGQVHPQLCIPDLVAVQQRGRVCAAVGYTVLKAISEKYPDYYSPEVFVQGVLKAYPLKGNGPVNTEVFSRSYELRLPNTKFVQRTIKHVMEKMRQAHQGDREEMMESVEAKKFLLAVVAALPYPNGDQAQALITQAGEAGIMMGTAAMTMLKTDLAQSGYKEGEEGAEKPPAAEISESTLKLMEEAARAHLLLELRKLLSNVYAGKTAFPVDIGVPYLADNLLACETVHECYTTLKNSLRQASDAPAPGTQVTGKKRGRPAKHVEKSIEEEDAEMEKEMMAEMERLEKGGGDSDSDAEFANTVEMMHDD